MSSDDDDDDDDDDVCDEEVVNKNIYHSADAAQHTAVYVVCQFGTSCCLCYHCVMCVVLVLSQNNYCRDFNMSVLVKRHQFKNFSINLFHLQSEKPPEAEDT